MCFPNEPELVLIRGLPGSGKSTLARQYLNHQHLEADMYFEQGGEYQFDGAKLSAAHQWCQQQARAYLAKGRSVVVANTFVRLWELEPYLNIAKDMHVNYRLIKAEGRWSNVHGVPKATVDRMRSQWQE